MAARWAKYQAYVAKLEPCAKGYVLAGIAGVGAFTFAIAAATVPSAAGPGLSPLTICLLSPVLSAAFVLALVLAVRNGWSPNEGTSHRLASPLRGLLSPFLKSDSDDEAALRIEQGQHALSQLEVLMVINIINAVLIVYSVQWTANLIIVYSWFASVFGLSLVALHARQKAAQRERPSKISKRTIRRIVLHSGIRGACWGMPFALFFASSDSTAQLILLSVSAGMAAGGIPALAPIPAAALLYGLGILFPTLLALVATGNPALLVLVSFGLTFSAGLAAVAMHLYWTFTSNLFMRRDQAEQSATISLLLNEFEASASDWLWETDQAGNLVRMPARMSECFGISPSLASQANFVALIAVLDQQGATQISEHLEARTPFRQISIKTIDAQDKERWTALSASPKADGGWRGVGSDITAKVIAEHEAATALARAERAEQRLKDGIDALGPGFILTDREDRTLIANRRFQQLLPAATLAGAQARLPDIAALQAGLWFAQDSDRQRAFVERLHAARDASAGLESKDVELPNGVWLRIESAATTEGGTVTVLTDITDIKQQEALLAEQAGRLARSNAELQNFATVASHDLQEPLRKIDAFGSRLQKRNEATLDDESKMYLERMMAATQRMRTLITDLLSYSRVTRKNEPFRPVSLDKIMRDVVEDLGIAIEEKGADVDVGPLGHMNADRTQLRQLMQNLISNALKFVKPDVPPAIRVERRDRPDGSAELRIADNGIGFDMTYHDKIFEIFQRLHGREEYQGTGVGLATCRRIVERHGGTLRAESAAGAGATFIATFPPGQMRIADAASAATDAERPQGKAATAA